MGRSANVAVVPAVDARTQREPARHRRRRLARARDRHRQPAHPDQLPRHERRERPRSLGRRLESRPPPRPPARLLPGRRRELRPRRAARRGRARDACAPSIGAAAAAIAFSFRVDTPYPTAGVPEFPNPTAAPADYQSFDTLPGVQAPILTVTVPDRDPAAGDVLTTNGPGPGRYGPLIYTPQGRLVWFDQLSGGEAAEDLNEQTYEGQRDLTWWQGRVLSLGFGQGEDLVMSSRYQTVATGRRRQRPARRPARLPDRPRRRRLHHRVQPDPLRPAPLQGPPRRGDRGHGDPGDRHEHGPRALGMAQPRPRRRVRVRDRNAVADDRTPWDWFHLNSIDPEPDGDIFISARSTWAGYQLQGGSGRILWRLGGLKSSFKMGPRHGNGVAARRAHARRRRGHLLRRRLEPADPSASRAPCGSRSTSRPTRRACVSAYTHANPPLLAASQGNMQTLADGNTVVGYGGVPAISEYARGGSLLFDAHLPYDMIFYRAFRFPWSGRPLTPAGGARQPQRHGRRDDRARELERRERSRVVARARGQAHRIADGAGDDPRERLRELDDAAPAATPAWRCRRSTRPATCSAPRRPVAVDQLRRLAAEPGRRSG